MNNPARFGCYLKTLRKDKGLSQTETAISIGITRSRYSNYENGYSIPPKDILKKLSDLFGVNLSEVASKDKRQNSFIENYNHKIEQMLFYEELTDLRRYIDGIEDKKERRKVAIQLADLLDEFLKSLQAKQNGGYDKIRSAHRD